MSRSLDPFGWSARLAARAVQMKRNAVREFLKITADPRIISFAGGLPAPDLFPIDELEAAFQAVMKDRPVAALQYGETEGVGPLRDWIAEKYSRPNLRLARPHVAIFSGAQQALDLLGRVFLDVGDAAIVESPTYLALLAAWRASGAQLHAVPSDADGMQVDQLEATLPARTKLAYVIPNFQNPQGTTLSLTRRHSLVRTARQRGFGIVEDDAYGALRYEGTDLPSLLELDAALAPSGPGNGPGNVIYVGSFSKILVPGLRVGWVIAAEEVIEKLVQAKQGADLHTSSLSQHLILELVRSGMLEQHIPRLRAAYRQRRDTLLRALGQHLPEDARWTRPEGGLFVFLTLPSRIDSHALLQKCLEHQVAFVPGREFHLDDHGTNTLRLNFSNATPDRIELGVARFAQALNALR